MCRKQLQVIFGHKVNKTFKSYIPRGEIICSQKDASAFIGRVGFFLRLSIWLTFSSFLMMLSCVREVPGPYIKDADMRVRESSLFSGGVSIFLVGTKGMGLVASLCGMGSPAALVEAKHCTVAAWCNGAALQQAATSRGDWKTISRIHAWENSVAKD